jgi:hypothetical protein
MREECLQVVRSAGRRFQNRNDPTPGVFLHKNVILRELSCEIAQECDSKGFNAGRTDPAVGSELPKGLVEAITTHASTNC